jgi:hypothetical protein
VRTLIAFLFIAFIVSVAHGAQPGITIPEGTSEYGPVAVTTLHRFAGLYVERTSSSFAKGTFKLFHSTDGGKTFPGDTGNSGTEKPFCKFTHLGGAPVTQTFGADCPKPEGTTHIKARAIVEGGSITLASQPNLRSR